MLIQSYSLHRYPFYSIIQSMFTPPLYALHKESIAQGDTDQSTLHHKTVYDKLYTSQFYTIYDDFVKRIVSSYLPPLDWSVQVTPTFRFQYPEKRGTKEFHRDRDYNHSPETLNIVVPLTDMQNTTAIHLEVAPYLNSFTPMNVRLGEFAMFDGANILHGTFNNEEGYTRVSFDFRLLPTSRIPLGETVTQKVPFSSYYRKV